jgi:hypothetical protein
MDLSIDLNRKVSIGAQEIDDESTDGMLPPEVEARSSRAQSVPEEAAPLSSSCLAVRGHDASSTFSAVQ